MRIHPWDTLRDRGTLISSFACWFLSAFDFFVLIVIAPYIADDLHGRDPKGYQTLQGLLSWCSHVLRVQIVPLPSLGIPQSAGGGSVDPTPVIFLTVTATLLFRWVGALLFGWAADRWGRKPTLLANILFCSLMQLLTPLLATGFIALLVLRAIFGVGMGGAWGVGASLAMEQSQPPDDKRGLYSGIFQSGYPAGSLVAALVALLLFPRLIDWHGMFVLASLLALPVVWLLLASRDAQPIASIRRRATGAARRSRARRAAHAVDQGHDQEQQVPPWASRGPRVWIYAVVLMLAFTCMAHASQDIYPTFLTKQVGLPNNTKALIVPVIVAISSFGGIIGGVLLGRRSEQWTRRRTILICASIGLIVIPVWCGLFPLGGAIFTPHGFTKNVSLFSPEVLLLGIGAFLMQFAVQGAYGVIPAHLNEIAPPAWRGTFAGVVYGVGASLGSFAPLYVAAYAVNNAIAPVSQSVGSAPIPNYAWAEAVAMVLIFAAVVLLTALGAVFGPDRTGRVLSTTTERSPQRRRRTLSPVAHR